MRTIGIHDLETGEAAGDLLLIPVPTLSVSPRLLLPTRHLRAGNDPLDRLHRREQVQLEAAQNNATSYALTALVAGLGA